MSGRSIDPYQEVTILRLAARRKGFTRVECAERFGVSYLAAWRSFARLVAKGLLWPTGNSRRRSFLYRHCPKGSVVFSARHPGGRLCP